MINETNLKIESNIKIEKNIKVEKNYYPIFIITLCAAFLFYKYILQIYPSIITNQLMQDYHLTGAGLGNLAATFYYSYIVSQFFVGIILDKYGTRWITTVAIFGCALGVGLFSQTQTVMGAGLSRALMGVGVSFATVAYMKLASVWFPPHRYAFVSGLLATAAMAGAVFGEAPLSWIIHHIGWRECLYWVGWAGIILTGLFLLIVRDRPSTTKKKVATPIQINDVWQVLRNKQNWLLTCYGGLAYSPIAIFGGLWGNPFLQQAYHLTQLQAASLVTLVFIGLGVGSPLLGMLSDSLQDRRNVMFYSTLLGGLSISLVLYGSFLPLWLVGILLFTFGFSLGAFMLVFTIGKEINRAVLTATVIAMINASDAILDAITEPAIGKLLDWGWDGKIVNGVHYFSLHSYHLALSVLPIYLGIAALLVLKIK